MKKGKTRLFSAINFKEREKKKIHSLLPNISWPKKGCSLTIPENYHITMRFWGEVDQDQQGKIIKLMEKTSEENRPFNVLIKSMELFPNAKEPKYLALILERNDNLIKIAKQLGEKKEYRPHVTLVRFRKRIENSLFEQINDFQINPFSVQVNSIELMESEMTPAGSIYKINKKFNLIK